MGRDSNADEQGQYVGRLGQYCGWAGAVLVLGRHCHVQKISFQLIFIGSFWIDGQMDRWTDGQTDGPTQQGVE